MKFTITIGIDNDAFQPEPALEVGRILANLASHLDRIGSDLPEELMLRDINGNTVGVAKVVDE